MAISSGVLALNGITDQDLVRILEVKIKHEKHINFNPQQLQPQHTQTGQFYNNVTLGWNSDEGLEAVQKIILILLRKEERGERAVAAGQ